MPGSEPRNTGWSYTALRAEYGEEGALEMLPRMPGKGQYVDYTTDSAFIPQQDRVPYRDVEMHHVDGLPAWVMPWDTWSHYGAFATGPVYPDGVWMTNRSSLADQAPRESKREAFIPQKWSKVRR